MFLNPGDSATLDLRRQGGIFAGQRSHSGDKSQSIEFVNREGAITALRAPRLADKPWAGTPRRIGQGCIYNLHELLIRCRQRHDGHDT
jgi:hypothetical protein